MNELCAKWITNSDFCSLKPIYVFHKELEKQTFACDEKYSNKHILFRKKFQLSGCKKATVRISADDYYKLYINGQFVTQGPAPGYDFHYYYNEIDITEYIVNGENTIAVHTYYLGLVNRVWVSADLCHGLVLDLWADETKLLETDETWKCAYHSGYTDCGKFGYDTQFAEMYNAGSSEVGFEYPDFDDSDWESAKIRQNCSYKLFKQPTEQLKIYDVKPKLLKKTEHGYFVDFGFEAVGYLKFNASGNAGSVVVMHYAEELNDDGTPRWHMRCNCDYEEKFILSGKKCDTLRQYDYKAFRYAEIILPDGASADENSVVFTVRHYPFKEIKHYSGDNPKLEKIYKLCSDTLKYGVQECYMDCPTREKGQYLGDVTISGIAHLELTGNADMIKKALDNFTQSSFICKGLMTVAPSSYMQEIADYSLQFPFQVLWVYKYTKDIDFLKKMYPFVMNVYDYFYDYRCENGLISGVKDKWNLIDWPRNLRDNYDFPDTRVAPDGFHNVINGFYLAMLKHIDEIRAILGIEPTGAAEQTQRSYIDAFYDSGKKLFTDALESNHISYHSNVLALFADVIVDDDNRKAMIELIKNKKFTCGGVYMAFFAGYALKVHGETKLMEELIADSEAWSNMLSEGATTCFEAWGKDQKWNTSLFHPWAAAPAILLD